MMKTITRLSSALLLGGLLAAQTQNPVSRLLDRIVSNEQQFVSQLTRYRPILETYIQEIPENAGPGAPPANDHYWLGELDLTKADNQTTFLSSNAFQRRRGFLRRGGSPVLSPAGFATMVVPDQNEFSRDTYEFDYIQREFLGELRCLVMDVTPKDKKAAGKFIGRIWVEDQDYRIVRFNGTYTASKASTLYFHFDGWRVNVAPGLWMPAFVYVEDSSPLGPARNSRFKAQTRLWGYNITRSSKWEELTGVLIEAENPVRDQTGSRDVSPIESQRSWKKQAAENVLQHLEKSGLLAPQGEVEQVLNTVVNNLVVTNNISLDVQCRVLLTTPLETFSLDRTIVISRGLLDVLPDEASLAMVLSLELAHIVLGHGTETMYAFGDRTMLAGKETLQKLRFHRSEQESDAAGLKAVEMLSASPYKDKLGNAGLFLRALAGRAPRLPKLIEANLGNQLASPANLYRLSALADQAPALEESKIEQVAALPLGSRIRLDPWTNRITLIKTKPVALLTPEEKMPFEVTPVMLYLTRLPGAPQGTAATARVP